MLFLALFLNASQPAIPGEPRQQAARKLGPVYDPPVTQFGASLCALDSTDPGDGLLLVGDPLWPARGHAHSRGAIHVYSTCTFEKLRTIPGPVACGYFGARMCAVSDVDGDGVQDLLVSESTLFRKQSRYVWLLSGRTFDVLRTHAVTGRESRFGESLLSMGDVDGDGLGDYVIGDPSLVPTSPGGEVILVSGGSGAVLWRACSRIPGEHFGWALAAVSDVDGDGRADLAVGTSMLAADRGSTGFVSLLSSKHGLRLVTRRGEKGRSDFGANLLSIADANGDGQRDLVVSDADDWSENSATSVWVLSGMTLETISVLGLRDRPETVTRATRFAARLGYSLAAVPDLDGDSVPDVAAGDHDGGGVILLSARTGRQVADSPFRTMQRVGLCQVPLSIPGSQRAYLAVSEGSPICCYDVPGVWILGVEPTRLVTIGVFGPPR